MSDYEIARPNHIKVLNDLMAMNLDPNEVLNVLLRWMPDDEIKKCMKAHEMWIEEED